MRNEIRSNKKILLSIWLFLLCIVKGEWLLAQKPEMYYGDLDIPTRPYAKDPYVIFSRKILDVIFGARRAI
jgi:hypothetical protein